MEQALPTSHSADVRMWLDCGQHGTLALNRITPKSVIALSPRDIPPCYADLVVTVDGHLIRKRVNLAGGFTKIRRAALVLAIDDIAPF